MLKMNAAKIGSSLAAGAAVLFLVSAPAFAGQTLGLSSMMVVADIGHDVQAFTGNNATAAKIVRAAPAEMPAISKLQNLNGTAAIEIDLDATGALTQASVVSTTGSARLDRSALAAVRASRYQAATLNGAPISGSYLVEVSFDSAE
jgi:TonB family protein